VDDSSRPRAPPVARASVARRGRPSQGGGPHHRSRRSKDAAARGRSTRRSGGRRSVGGVHKALRAGCRSWEGPQRRPPRSRSSWPHFAVPSERLADLSGSGARTSSRAGAH